MAQQQSEIRYLTPPSDDFKKKKYIQYNKSCKKYNVCIENEKYPAAMMVKELIPHVLDGHRWIYHDSPVMAISEEEAARYDDTLEKMEKKWLPSQEEFYILSHSTVS